MKTLRALARASALAACLLFFALDAWTQAFPAKPVHVIVPFPPGGGADALARIMGPYLTRIWGQPVIVENKAGASGQIGADFVANAPADGYTVMMSSTASLTERNAHQFAPVTLVSASPYVIVANSKIGVSDVRGLIDYARRNPGKLTYGSSGTGAASHLSAELFKSLAGIDMLHVPYKGTGQAVTDLLAGQIDVMFAPAQTVMPHVQAGRLKALAVTSARRATTLPQLPTAAESGLPGYEAIGWFGLLAPVATPAAIVAKLSADANKVLAEPEVKEKMLALGAEPSGNTPEQFARFIREDQAKWSKLMPRDGVLSPGS